MHWSESEGSAQWCGRESILQEVSLRDADPTGPGAGTGSTGPASGPSLVNICVLQGVGAQPAACLPAGAWPHQGILLAP